MRLIGHLDDERRARAFSDVLYTQDIENEVEADGSRWAIWVHEEEQLGAATKQLEEFKVRPDDRRFVGATREAREKRERKEQELTAAERRFYDRDRLFADRLYRLGGVTAALMAISVVITIATGFGKNELFPNWFAIEEFVRMGDMIRFEPPESALLRLEIWRWFTPMFVHMDIPHIFFDLWWLKDLGSLVESRIGRWRFLGLVLMISGPANVAEFILSSPAFGGMSGVIYGLFGYIWVREKVDPEAGLAMDPMSRMIMMGWYFLCLANVIPNVANVVHTTGLLVGLLAGWLAAKTRTLP